MTFETYWLLTKIVFTVTALIIIIAAVVLAVFAMRQRDKSYRDFTTKRLQRRPVSRTMQRYTPEVGREGERVGDNEEIVLVQLNNGRSGFMKKVILPDGTFEWRDAWEDSAE